MSITEHTDPSRLDLSDDADFAYLVKRHLELSEKEAEARKAYAQRKEIDEKIAAKLGNAKSAKTSYGEVVSLQTVRRKEYTVKAVVYTCVKVRAVKLKGGQDDVREGLETGDEGDH